MYTKERCKEIMKEIDKIDNWTCRKVLRSIVMELTEDSKEKETLEKEFAVKEKVVDEKEIVKYITETIIRLGVPANLRGYYYIKEAIMLSVLDMNKLDKVTTRLYPKIAKKYDTTPPRVERAIRHAIETAWSRGEIEACYDIFGYTIKSEKGRPTNSEFIALLSDRVKMKFDI